MKKITKKFQKTAKERFFELCNEFPDCGFVGNCHVNAFLLKGKIGKDVWICNGKKLKKSLFPMKNYIMYTNTFKS